ncbi:MAG: hypothetical protein A2X86_15580 [Bdellovibrionales bacterium GWA2_49_15]|nr:MAG: hypothetical protein A2X86_15580 [Bdellovibrionales bacterium GWA2_49_15]HAZ14551.1 hypothetical protein [Bdellovibrionales bacterium]
MKIFLTLLCLFLLSCENGGDEGPYKADWIKNSFLQLTQNAYPRVKAISWWHENFDQSKLRIDSSPEALAEYQKGVSNAKYSTELMFSNKKLVVDGDRIYHGAFPDMGGEEDVVTTAAIRSFESLAKKEIAWVYFSDNWLTGINFPSSAVETIVSMGKTPFIRMMARSNFDENTPDPNYSMAKIISGVYDTQLKAWATKARATNVNLLIEFGTEANGQWFPWNGQHNGGGTTTNYGDPTLADGPERFRDAYRHIIDIFKALNVDNVTWFFHVDAYGDPEVSWNEMKNYFPGESYIDWIGVSVYGPQTPKEDYDDFKDIMDLAYPKLTALSPTLPIAILEFAVTEKK